MRQVSRLLAIAAVLDGASREEAALVGGMDRQTLRDWVIRFNGRGPEGLINMPSPGAPSKLDVEHKEHDGNEVKLDVKTLMGITDRIHPRFIGHLLDGGFMVRTDAMDGDHGSDRKSKNDREIEKDRIICGKVKGWFIRHDPCSNFVILFTRQGKKKLDGEVEVASKG